MARLISRRDPAGLGPRVATGDRDLDYRLPPTERRRWDDSLEALCGPGFAPIELLHRAQSDALARRMLRDAEED